MSSNPITSVQHPDVTRLHRAQASDRPEVFTKPTAEERNESSSPGKDVPQGKVNTDEQSAKVESAVSKISDFVQNFQRDLLFSIDKESDRLVVKVVDSETQEVIRQIPSEETLRIARNLDSPESLILREQA